MAVEYKKEKQQKAIDSVNEKIKNWTPSLRRYFNDNFGSKQTAATRYPTIKLFLEWLIQKGIINKSSLDQITDQDLSFIKQGDLKEYLRCLKEGNGCRANSIRTIRLKIRVIKSLWDSLLADDIVSKNIVSKPMFKIYKEENTNNAFASDAKIKIAKPKELDEFINNMKKGIANEFVLYRNITIVELFLATGIRKAELVGLDLTDVFPEKNIIMVMRKGNQEKSSEIAVPKGMMDALIGYISMRNKIGFATNALFVSHRTGKRVGEETIRKFFDVYSNGKITPHKLRHTYGSSIYADTGDIKLVQEQLGHASVETTAKNYVMVDEERSIAAINSLSCWRFD